MSKKCEVCGKWLKNNKGYNIHYERMHGKKQMVDIPQMEEILNRIRKLELDNSFLKCQVKHKVFVNSSKDSELDWDIPKEVKEAKDETKVVMNVVVKELKVIFTEDFNYKDFLKPINPIEIPVIQSLTVEVLA